MNIFKKTALNYGNGFLWLWLWLNHGEGFRKRDTFFAFFLLKNVKKFICSNKSYP